MSSHRSSGLSAYAVRGERSPNPRPGRLDLPQHNITAQEPGSVPELAFAFGPFGIDRLFSSADLQRLSCKCRIGSAAPLQDFSNDAARALISQTEIMITGWGCPRIDAALLQAAPHLKMIAHAAGSVK